MSRFRKPRNKNSVSKTARKKGQKAGKKAGKKVGKKVSKKVGEKVGRKMGEKVGENVDTSAMKTNGHKRLRGKSPAMMLFIKPVVVNPLLALAEKQLAAAVPKKGSVC